VFLEYLDRFRPIRVFVATYSRAIVGYTFAFHTQTHAEIHSVAVAPAHRGRGIAVALLKRVIGLLKRRGFTTGSLNVRLENKPAMALYRDSAFRECGGSTGTTTTEPLRGGCEGRSKQGVRQTCWRLCWQFVMVICPSRVTRQSNCSAASLV
jgi:L-amino acid N-acyltransferase YncA